MGQQIAGKATIQMDGAKLATKNGATLMLEGAKRTAERHGGKTYYREEEEPGTLDCTVLITSDYDAKALNAMKDATGIFTTDTGQKFLLRKCNPESPMGIDTSNGEHAVKFFFDSSEAM